MIRDYDDAVAAIVSMESSGTLDQIEDVREFIRWAMDPVGDDYAVRGAPSRHHIADLRRRMRRIAGSGIRTALTPTPDPDGALHGPTPNPPPIPPSEPLAALLRPNPGRIPPDPEESPHA